MFCIAANIKIIKNIRNNILFMFPFDKKSFDVINANLFSTRYIYFSTKTFTKKVLLQTSWPFDRIIL